MKPGMKVDLRTSKSEKYQKSGYLDNRCYGEQKTISQLKYSLYLNQNLVGRSKMDIQKKMHKISVSMVTNILPWQSKRGFEDQKTFPQLKYSLHINQNMAGGSGMDIGKNPQNICFHGNQEEFLEAKTSLQPT